MVSKQSIAPEKTVTHTFELEESEKAFQCAYTPEEGAVKVVIRCNA